MFFSVTVTQPQKAFATSNKRKTYGTSQATLIIKLGSYNHFFFFLILLFCSEEETCNSCSQQQPSLIKKKNVTIHPFT